MILTQQSEFHPLSVHTKPHVGSTEHPHLGLRSASLMVKLRSASSAARSFRATSPAKTTNEGKGHFISHPRGVGFVASLSKCNVGTLQKTGPKYCPALKKKKNCIHITMKSKANAKRFWAIRVSHLGSLTQFSWDSICSNCCQYIFRSSQRSRWGQSESIIFSYLDPGGSSVGDNALQALRRFPYYWVLSTGLLTSSVVCEFSSMILWICSNSGKKLMIITVWVPASFLYFSQHHEM